MTNVRLGDSIRTKDGRYYEAGVQESKRGITVRAGSFYRTVDAEGAVIIRTRIVAFAPRRTYLEQDGTSIEAWFEAYKERALNDENFTLSGSLTVGMYRAGRQDPAYVATWKLGLYEHDTAVLSVREEPVTI